jgi:Cdc6-like AAA superfamily ATPase
VNYNKALEERFAETGIWFTESLVASNWKTAPGSFLWLYGIPGCGKTILSSTIIEAIFDHCSNNSSLAVLYFYFDFNDAEKQRPESTIRSLIIQLSLQCISVPQTLNSLYRTCTDGQRQPAYDSLLETLQQMIGVFQEIYLVIDALDESSDRYELLANIKEMTSWKDANLHTLVTSRREKDIVDSMEYLTDQEKVCIQNIHINDDIRAYVRGRLFTDPKLKRWRNQPRVQLEIEITLMEKVDGM